MVENVFDFVVNNFVFYFRRFHFFLHLKLVEMCIMTSFLVTSATGRMIDRIKVLTSTRAVFHQHFMR